MLGLSGDNQAASGGEWVKDSSEATFMADVIEASQDVPVIVDFWAPWCGPCRQLGPALEAAVGAAKGRVRMVKINVDENQGIAGQLRIQSIPTVYAFHQGRPVDAFQGALPNSEVKAFVEKLAALAPADEGLEAAIAEAETMLAEGAAEDAAEVFAAILGEEPENAGAFGGLIRSLLAQGKLDEAGALLEAVPAAISGAQEVEAGRAQLALARQAAEAGPADEFRAKLEQDPADHQARFDLALALQAAGDTEGAIDTLLELFRRDREWNEGAAKAQLITIFDALKPNDPLVLKGRRRLASLVFG